MNILVFNCGSSSLKYRLLAMPEAVELAGGEAQRVGPPTAKPSVILYHVGREKFTREVPMANHAVPTLLRSIGSFGCRVSAIWNARSACQASC